MNNDQFRKLLLANAAKSAKDGTSSTPKGPGATPSSTLGSRIKSSIPMTPRSVAGGGRNNEFARQLAERDNPGQPKKKYRTSAPKGSRFVEGYVDRAKERQAAADAAEDDKAARIKALEESLKKEEIDQATFDKLSSEIAGGDLSSTHLIKGLDFKLLERIRKGEDVFGDKAAAPSAPEAEVEVEDGEHAPGEDVDDAFEELQDKEVEAVVKEKAKKKGQLATTTLVPGQKRSRDQILAEMKAAREAAKANQLGSRFKKIGAKKEPGSRIERDAKGREVLIIVDEDGNERRKVRKVAAEVEKEREAFKVAPDAEVLGMQVPEYYQKKKLEEQQKEEDEDVKMFSDVESDYDPLQGLGSDSDDDESGDEAKKQARSKSPDSRSPRSEGEVGSESPPPAAKTTIAPPSKPRQAAQQPRNYFRSGGLISEQKVNAPPALTDPSVLAALKKAKTLNAQTKSEEEQKEAEREAKLKKMLASADRDDADMDMGFGESRQQDDEEMEDDGKTKLSAWGGAGADDDDDERGGGKAKRKRGGKKRKGDGNNVADVMRVLEKRKETGA